MTARLPMLLIVMLAASPLAAEEEMAARERLRVATWDFADAVAAGALKREEAKKPVWRTTFGAERYTVSKPTFDPTNVEADVLLLQGVTSVREARQFFPARHWRLIVSRQLLEQGEDGAARAPLTAIAIRSQKGLKFAGQEHFPRHQGEAAGIAVRLLSHGRTVWVASAVLSRSCTAKRAECPAALHLDKWQLDKAAAGATAIVLGGRILEPARAKTAEIRPVAQAAPAPEPAMPQAAPKPEAEPARSKPETGAAPVQGLVGWLMGWEPAPAAARPAQAPAAKPADRLPAIDQVMRQPPAPAASPPAPAKSSPASDPIGIALKTEANSFRLARSDDSAKCAPISLAGSVDGAGLVKAAEQGFYLEAAGCLAYLDLSIEPAPPPPPESWPEAVEPAGSSSDPDEPINDAG